LHSILPQQLLGELAISKVEVVEYVATQLQQLKEYGWLDCLGNFREEKLRQLS
jgi:hypothetical protein